MKLAPDVDLEEVHKSALQPINHKIQIADECHGYVGADLASLAAEAAMHHIQAKKKTIKNRHQAVPKDILDSLAVTQHDFEVSSSFA